MRDEHCCQFPPRGTIVIRQLGRHCPNRESQVRARDCHHSRLTDFSRITVFGSGSRIRPAHICMSSYVNFQGSKFDRNDVLGPKQSEGACRSSRAAFNEFTTLFLDPVPFSCTKVRPAPGQIRLPGTNNQRGHRHFVTPGEYRTRSCKGRRRDQG